MDGARASTVNCADCDDVLKLEKSSAKSTRNRHRAIANREGWDYDDPAGGYWPAPPERRATQ